MHYLGQLLLQNALVYAGWPEGTWREINAIYAYASQNRIHQIPVKAEDGRSGTPNTTIEDLFKGLMLFASATPHRLRQSHAKLLFAYLEPWSAYTMILTDDDGGTSEVYEGYHLWLESSDQPDVRRLSCRGVYAMPAYAKPPSIAEIRAALGAIATLRLP